MANVSTLNLAYPENSQIPFRINRFPDGQQSITLQEPGFLQNTAVKIYTRLNTFQDLELVICATQALRNNSVSQIFLYSPYFIGARSDRRFTPGDVNYLKQVICPIINSQKFDAVMVLDPHSDVLEACLDNFEKIDNHLIVKYALEDIDNKNGAQDRIVLVSPDAGAYKKIFDVAQKFKIEKVVTAMKHRDINTGQINSTEVPNLPINTSSDEDFKYVIVDDICDGGRTFVELAKAIQNQRPDAKIYLIVTHGIFSAGFDELSKWFEKIYASNSVKDVENSQLTQFNVF
jgi:ribose-phosphate pyrophosphokinase